MKWINYVSRKYNYIDMQLIYARKLPIFVENELASMPVSDGELP